MNNHSQNSEQKRAQSRQDYERIRGGDHRAQNLQNEGTGSSAAGSTIGNARHTGGEPLAVAIERLRAITSKTSNTAAQGMEIAEDAKAIAKPKSREYQRITMQRYKWNLQLDALGLPRIAKGRQNLPASFSEYLAEQGYTNALESAKTERQQQEWQAVLGYIDAAILSLQRAKTAISAI